MNEEEIKRTGPRTYFSVLMALAISKKVIETMDMVVKDPFKRKKLDC